MERTRRSVLATGVAALTAGCFAPAPGEREDLGTTTTGTTTTTRGSALAVEDIAVTPEYVALNSPDSIGTYGARDEQFLVATVGADGGDAPDVDDVSLTVGDETFARDGTVGGMGGRLWAYGDSYARAEAGWIAYSLPKPLEAPSGSLAWPGGEHPLPGSALERLERPPTDFELRDLSVPGTIRPDEDLQAELTVANVGDTDGVFVGALNRVGPYVAYAPAAAVSLPVPAGEAATWQYTNAADDRYGDGEGTMRLLLNWRDGDASRELSVTAGTTDEGSLPDGVDRVTTPPYEIGDGECDLPETERDPLYLCANMPAEPSLSFTQVETTGVVFDGEGIATSDDRTTPQFYAALLTGTEDLDRIDRTREDDAVQLIEETAFESQSVLLAQTGWGSGSKTPHLKRVEETESGVRAYGCARRPCGFTDDLTVRTAAARFDDPETLDTAVVTLTVSPERRVSVAASEGAVTVE